MMRRNKIVSVCIVAVMVFYWAGTAFGHAAIVWAYVENNRVYVEAFFANGAKIQNTQVVVVDENGNKVLEGKTDTEGKFSYKPVSKNPQTVVVMAGESHIGDFELTAEDLADVELE